MLFDPQFTEETLWLREVDGLAQSDTARKMWHRVSSGSQSSSLARSTPVLFSVLKGIEKGLHGFMG